MKLKYLIVLFCILTQGEYFISKAQSEPILVIIDPGHGGKDPGNLASSSKYLDEKGLNLLIAKKLCHYIDSLLDNVTVKYTRETDVYISPQERTEMANNDNADCFISIHCNYNPISTIKGCEIHIHNNNCKNSRKFAKLLEHQFHKRAMRPNRGIKTYYDRRHTNLLVVKDTEMPAVLVECGFMSNPEEELYLNTDYGQSIIASAIFRAFREYAKIILTEKTKEKIDEPTTITKEKEPDCDVVFRVQIKASVEKIALGSWEFKNVNMPIKEHVAEEKATFKYKYTVGHKCTFEEANKLKNELRKKGFKDAFVVSEKKK